MDCGSLTVEVDEARDGTEVHDEGASSTERDEVNEVSTRNEEGGHEHAATTELMDEDGENAPNQSSSRCGNAGTGVNHRKREAEAEHPEGIERERETADSCMRTEEEGRKMNREENREILQEARAR